MRSEEDVIKIRIELTGTIELDRQRMVEEDPNWAQISSAWDLSTQQELEAAISQYITHYIVRERFLRDMPTTNGPGELIPGRIEITLHTEVQNGNSSGSSSGTRPDQPEGERERQGPGDDTELSTQDPG